MRPASLVEQALNRVRVDAPRVLRDMAGRAAPPVSPLCLKVLTGQIDDALRAERRAVSGGISERLIVVDTASRAPARRERDRSVHPSSEEQGDRRGRMDLSDRQIHNIPPVRPDAHLQQCDGAESLGRFAACRRDGVSRLCRASRSMARDSPLVHFAITADVLLQPAVFGLVHDWLPEARVLNCPPFRIRPWS